MSSLSDPILIIGANGKTGSRVAELLTAQGHVVRGVSRSTTPRFDWEDSSSWAAALSGCRAVYITYQPDLAVPGAVETIRAFVDQALSLGVNRLVMLSGRGEREAEEAERVLMQSTADWTVVRASWFDQNFSESFLLDSLQAGDVMLPLGDVKEPFIDLEDIAEILTAALLDEAHVGKLYEVTGPELLSFPEAVAAIAKASGREITYREVSMAEYEGMLEQHGVPADYVWLLRYLFTEVLDGRNELITTGVEHALGRPAKRFSDYVARTVATGIWGGEA